MSNIAFITGINGQDGSYLSELLLSKDYFVYGIVRKSSSINTKRLDHIYNNKKFILRYGDMLDSNCLLNIFIEIKNTYEKINKLEVYNLAAVSHVKVSFELPIYISNVNALGTLRLLESIKSSGLIKIIRFYQASTSELYGKISESPQNEKTEFNPRSPYAISKLYSYWIVNHYREAYNMFACNGILFNHSSPRRGETFILRKISLGLKRILEGDETPLILGNLNSKRDIGHAKDYINGMWLMLQQDYPDDFVLSTGIQFTIREMVEKIFLKKNISIIWKHKGLNEIGIDKKTKKILIKISEKYFRPLEVNELLGDSTKAKKFLNWSPKINFDSLINEIVDFDCKK